MSTETIEYFIRSYGYWALFAGTLLEGETILVIGGLMAGLGLLDLPMVMLVAFLGSFTGDQFYFYLGRFKGQDLLSRHPKWQKRVARIHRYIERYHDLIMVGFRFIYGLRIITPFVMGMCRNLKASRFTTLNTVGAVLWSIVIASAGYFFGYAVEGFIKDIQHYELYAVLLVAGIGLVLWIFHQYKQYGENRINGRGVKRGD